MFGLLLLFGGGVSAQETELDVLKDIRTATEDTEVEVTALPANIDVSFKETQSFVRDQLQLLYYGIVYLFAIQFLFVLLFFAVFLPGDRGGSSLG